MIHFRFHDRVGKVCALVAASLILPSLAFADNTQGDSNNQGNAVPDGGPGILLLATTIGAIVVFSAIQRSRAKA